jgi:hypothetical protein
MFAFRSPIAVGLFLLLLLCDHLPVLFPVHQMARFDRERRRRRLFVDGLIHPFLFFDVPQLPGRRRRYRGIGGEASLPSERANFGHRDRQALMHPKDQGVAEREVRASLGDRARANTQPVRKRLIAVEAEPLAYRVE